MVHFDTSRLALVPLERCHAAELFDALRQPDVYRFISRMPPLSVIELETRFAHLETRRSPDGEESWLNWAVKERAGGAFVGLVEVTVQKQRKALLAYLFSPSVWGRGYAAEACGRVLQGLFDRPDVRMIEATTDTRNTRSRRLLEGLRFDIIEERESEEIIGGRKSREVLYRIEKDPHRS
jgi:ribosomal-protein-alanine N-acetyltransferase